MPTYLSVPKLGMALANATVVEWKVMEGERVEKGQAIVTIETQKTKFDIEAEVPGLVHILVAPDTEVAVGRVVGMLTDDVDELASLQKEPPKEINILPTEPDSVAPAVQVQREMVRTGSGPAQEGHIRISPVARRLAEEQMVDISKVMGTGPEGRIVREDIEKAIAGRKAAPVAQNYDGRRVRQTVPLKGMRRSIAEHMQRSLAISAQLTAIGEIDMSELLAMRQLLQKEPNARISFTDIIVFTLATALKEFPGINSSLIDNEIKIWDSIILASRSRLKTA